MKNIWEVGAEIYGVHSTMHNPLLSAKGPELVRIISKIIKSNDVN